MAKTTKPSINHVTAYRESGRAVVGYELALLPKEIVKAPRQGFSSSPPECIHSLLHLAASRRPADRFLATANLNSAVCYDLAGLASEHLHLGSSCTFRTLESLAATQPVPPYDDYGRALDRAMRHFHALRTSKLYPDESPDELRARIKPSQVEQARWFVRGVWHRLLRYLRQPHVSRRVDLVAKKLLARGRLLEHEVARIISTQPVTWRKWPGRWLQIEMPANVRSELARAERSGKRRQESSAAGRKQRDNVIPFRRRR